MMTLNTTGLAAKSEDRRELGERNDYSINGTLSTPDNNFIDGQSDI